MASLYVDAILFDMDGTLIDETLSYREAIRMTAEYMLNEAVSKDEVADIKRVPGFNNDWDATWGLVQRRLHGDLRIPSDADRSSDAYRRLRDVFQTYYLGDMSWRNISEAEPSFPWSEPLILRETPLVTEETMEMLSPYTLGVATSRPRTEALLAVRQHRLDRFFADSSIVAAEDAPYEKPHPAPLQVLSARLQCERPVYVGDTVNDALAASAAGMPFLLVGTNAFADTNTDARVYARMESVNEIPEVCVPLGRVGQEARG